MSETPSNKNSFSEEINLLDYLDVIFKRRRMIIRNSLLAGLMMLVLSFLLPKTYTATTTLLPPDEGDSNGLRSLLLNSPTSFLNLPGVRASSSDIFVEILKSRSVAEGVLQRAYDVDNEKRTLYEIWDEESREAAIKKLRKQAKIFSNEQGIVEISVEAETPELAAQIANAYTDELDKVNQEKSFSRAKNSRIYIEEQLKQTATRLQTSSKSLADFQSQYKAVDLEAQTKVALEKAGEIKGTIMAKEVQLKVALQTLKRNNPIISRFQKEVDELRIQYEHLQFGNSVPFEQQKDYFIPFADVPEVGLRLAELLREVKVQETVWQLLNQQFYSAKIQEARDTPTVQVLDGAVPPERRTRPKRKLLVVVTSFLTFVFSIFWAFCLEYVERSKENKDFQKMSGMVEELKADYNKLKKIILNLLNKSKN
ncbi:hypothetical protein IH970_13380 [candidate division KSB1 bacterium]|nr:hypothetical protein [candidate division KSB1 bacterium]